METTAAYTGKKFFNHSKFWEQKLSSIDNAFKVKGNKFNGDCNYPYPEYTFELNKKHTDLLEKYTGGRDLELFILLKAGFDILFSKYERSADVIIDTPLHKSSVTGEIVQAHVSLIQSVNKEESLKTLFQKVNQGTLESYKYQNFPYRLLAKDKSSADKFPLTNVALFDQKVHTAPPADSLKHYDLIIEIVKEAGVHIKISFNTEKFDQWFVENMALHFQNILSFFNELDISVKDISFLSEEQKNKLVNEFNQSDLDFPKDKTLVDVFEEHAIKTPENKALVYKNTTLTYDQLNQKSNQLAHYLRTECDVKPGACVAVLMDKSENSIISFLGILKAGGVYVPIDPKNPKERIRHVISETGLKTILTQSEYLFELDYFEGNLFSIDIQLEGLTYPTTNPDKINQVTDTAYIIYTSGSTGNPKGVVVEHQGVVNLAFGYIHVLEITPDDNILQFFSLLFDASVLDIVMALLGGATLVLADKETVNNSEAFAKYVEDNQITLMTLTPSYLHTLNRPSMDSLRIIITGGEAAIVDDALYYAKTKDFYNAYGPSEATVLTALYKVDPEKEYSSIPIGSPQSNKKVFILDEELNLVPEGIAGELCVSGVGLAREYLNDKDLTDVKFIENPYLPGERMYRTGDLAKWLPDGNIEFMGRKDDQIKVRGFRVELGEIESVLNKNSRVNEGVVLHKEGENNQGELIAFFTERRKVEIAPSLGEHSLYDRFVYQSMATDYTRISGYKKVIENLVKDKVVVDAGTGPDMILARQCLAEGAKKVYAVEISDEAYQMAQENLKKYGLQDKVVLIHGDISEVEFPEKVDVCVSALVGNIAGSDGCITMINNLKSNLKQEEPITFVPNKYHTKIGLASLPEDAFDYAFSHMSMHYAEDIFNKQGHKFDLRLCLRNFTRDYLISDDGLFEHIGYDENTEVEATNSVKLTVTKDGEAHGFALWINAMFDEKMIINSIEGTHHMPVYFPVFPEGVEMHKGDELHFDVRRKLSDDKLTTDYVLDGKIVRKERGEEPFTFESLNHGEEFRQNKFYEKLFNEKGEVKIISDVSEKSLKAYLSEGLPGYMVPNQIIALDEMPLSSNGKIDKKALLKLGNAANENRGNYVAPRTPEEKVLVAIWQEVLNKKNIGIKDDFFSLGGDSIKSIQIVAKVKKQLDKELNIGALYENKTIEDLAKYLADQANASLHNALMTGMDKLEAFKQRIFDQEGWIELPESYEDVYPLTPIELGMIYSSLMRPEEPVYHEQLILNVDIDNIDNFNAAIAKMVQRHTIYRTKYYMNSYGEPLKVVLKDIDLPVNFEDISNLSQAEKQIKIRTLTEKNLDARFKFDDELLWNLNVFKVEGDSCLIVFYFHHAISDGWSFSVFNTELSNLLDKEGLKDLPPLKHSYKDYCALILGREESDSIRQYWKDLLGGFTRNKLPFNFRRTKISDEKGMKSVRQPISKELLHNLEELRTYHSVSLKSIFLAAHTYLMHIVCSEEDVVTGMVTHDRPELEDGEKINGCFLNTIPVRVEFDKIKSGLQLIEFIHKYLIDVKPNEIHLSDIGQIVGEKASVGNPVFDTLLNFTDFHSYQEWNEDTAIQEASERLFDEETSISSEMTNTMFDLEVDKTQGSLSIRIQYIPAYFHRSEIGYALQLYVRILEQFVQDASLPISSVSLLTDTEKKEVLSDFNDTICDYSSDKSISQLFEARVSESPDQVALTRNQSTMTYEELNQSANQLARYLVSQGTKPGDNVGLLIGRGFDTVVGMYAVLKAGAAYVPIDPEYPVDRQQYIINNSGINRVVCDEDYPIIKEVDNVQFHVIDHESLKSEKTDNLDITVPTDQLAYTIYTSGSTGRPKGVMVEHRSAVNLIEWVNKTYEVGASDRLLFITSICFDLSVYDVFGMLSAGGTVVIAGKEEVQDVDVLSELMIREKITFWDSVPTTMNYLVGELEQRTEIFAQHELRLVFMSGDWIPVQLPDKVRKFFPNAQVISLGGATEGTVWSNFFPIEDVNPYWSSIPYGKPIANNYFYILDKNQEPVPYSVAGELYIGGIGVAKGYANDPEKTTKSFVKDPFNQQLGGRMYRTGDMGRMLPDGNMEFLGRVDHQVKIRGFRVELGEIESILSKHESISEAVVNVFTDSDGNNQLCGYYVQHNDIATQEIRDYLSQYLPGYMIPVYFVPMPSLPLTSNGKIDRKALPEPESLTQKTEFIAPRNEVEEKMVAIWEKILRKNGIGAADDFFELGGHSLSAMKLMAQIHKEFGVKVSVNEVFTETTIGDLSALVSRKVWAQTSDESVEAEESFTL
ncbi:amino acid adenylation domain-containing protein [Fulvivirga sp. 29W222]|uniref:Amino acid adenylation domain-containing protein n=1 Tax=Fulvivirga marina TaxID=2494733 RepID=A0A937G2Q0_9BACT|nr:non-ribosomal peptide synthetase [Fulvivirga marina]MBL6449151.1 amino acid adenylation domain-containing protein [Fulvivirga marina]